MKPSILYKLAALSCLASACGHAQLLNADLEVKPLAGPYYLRTDYEGYSCVQYGRGWLQPAPTLVGPAVDSVGEAGPYLAVCEGDDEAPRHYYLLPLAAASATQAQAERRGPLTTAAYYQWRRQVGGARRPLASVARWRHQGSSPAR